MRGRRWPPTDGRGARGGRIARGLLVATGLAVRLGGAAVAAEAPAETGGLEAPPPVGPEAVEPGAGVGAGEGAGRPAAKVTGRETRVHGHWRVTCETVAAAQKPRCVGLLQAQKKETGQVVFAWRVGASADGRMVSSFVTLSGVAIKPGVELRLGAAPTRRVGFSTCEPTLCTANAVIDEAFLRDLTAVDTASIVVRGSNGKAMTLDLPISGIGEVLALLRK